MTYRASELLVDLWIESQGLLTKRELCVRITDPVFNSSWGPFGPFTQSVLVVPKREEVRESTLVNEKGDPDLGTPNWGLCGSVKSWYSFSIHFFFVLTLLIHSPLTQELDFSGDYSHIQIRGQTKVYFLVFVLVLSYSLKEFSRYKGPRN